MPFKHIYQDLRFWQTKQGKWKIPNGTD